MADCCPLKLSCCRFCTLFCSGSHRTESCRCEGAVLRFRHRLLTPIPTGHPPPKWTLLVIHPSCPFLCFPPTTSLDPIPVPPLCPYGALCSRATSGRSCKPCDAPASSSPCWCSSCCWWVQTCNMSPRPSPEPPTLTQVRGIQGVDRET